MNTITTFEDKFEITFRDKCHDVAISGAPLTVKGLDNSIKTLSSPFTYHMWEFWQVKFARILLTSTPTPCPITYHITDDDVDRTAISTKIMRLVQSDPAKILVEGLFREE